MLGRPVPGVVGEASRVCHLFAVPADVEPASQLAALCGAQFGPGQLELLSEPAGMPCVPCLRAVPLPGAIEGNS
ncbi:hypothetical protein CFN78_18895 [Amycolatopsis antarctica]|uniref:Uncharacterized protein n=1 Tax=Amycolatopsis antarctica TaxID=1854586 RepID=A0A263D240_9PSEU|nr:hypothetical protein [Amycolatopsis antarctica]OZM71707.1 hypothetical protein CFN78_18895 [Amycolatopsis antarctica]